MPDNRVVPKMLDYLHMRAEQNRVPLSGTFELSPICNMDCRMCYVKMTKADMDASGGRLRTVDEWLEIAKSAQSRGMLLLLLTGGEPFLWPNFRELYTELKKLGLIISINTNGTLLDQESVDWLKQDPPSRINITLYGTSDETYGRLCGNPKGFTQVSNAIHMLREAGISVKLHGSITPHNYKDIPQMIQFAEERDLIFQASSYMFPPVRRDASKFGQNDRFSAEQASEIQADLGYRQYGKEWFQKHIETLRAGGGAIPYGEDSELDVAGEPMRCRAGKSSFWITWDGRMLPCGMINTPAAHPFEEGFDAAWNYIVDETAKIRLPSACASCEKKKQCNTCAAMVYTETGGFSEKPEYRCRMQEVYLPACEARIQQG